MASIEKIQIGGVTYDLSASGNYVEKTGDTMSGTLHVPDIEGLHSEQQLFIHQLDSGIKIENERAIPYDESTAAPLLLRSTYDNIELSAGDATTDNENDNASNIIVDGKIISLHSRLYDTAVDDPENYYYAADGSIQSIPNVSGYVAKAGDTMTGDLTMSNSKINFGTNLNVGVNSSNTGVKITAGANTFDLGTGGADLESTSGSIGIRTTSDGIHIDSGGGAQLTATGQLIIQSTDATPSAIQISADYGTVSISSNGGDNSHCYATDGSIQKIPTPGDPNQKAFSKVKVGSTTINSTTTTDTLELVAGTNVTLTPNTTNKTVTISASGGGTGSYLPLTGGTMSGDIDMDYGYSINNVNYVTNSLNPVYLQGVKGEVMVVDKTAVHPDSSLGLDLGTTSKLWNDVYANKMSSTLGFFQTSDKNLKNIHGEIDLNKAYDLIDKCSTILYDLKDDPKHKEQIGVIAQEIEEFFPEIINTDENGLKSVDYARLTVVIMRVLKDLMTRVTNIESKLK